jgi:hypothetical protein
MRIKAKELFKHDIKTYQSGKVYEVENGLGMYFVLNGWADEVGKSPSTRPEKSNTTLQPDDSVIGQGSE